MCFVLKIEVISCLFQVLRFLCTKIVVNIIITYFCERLTLNINYAKVYVRILNVRITIFVYKYSSDVNLSIYFICVVHLIMLSLYC